MGVAGSVLILNELIDKTKTCGRSLYVCFIDFKSTFDLVNRSAPLFKLFDSDIWGRFFTEVKSMYEHANSRMKWNWRLEYIFESLNSVYQRGLLNHTLVNIFMDDLSGYLYQSKGVSISNVNMNYFSLPIILFCSRKVKQGYRPSVTASSFL